MEEVSALKVRIKFSKEGPVKFLGHLDTMRYFQKALRRAKLPVGISGGFSPHIIMSVASPLGVGITSSGEYFDVEMTKTVSSEEILKRLNAVMIEGFQILEARQVEEGKKNNAMSLVAAADYLVTFRPDKAPCENWQDRLVGFYGQEQITVTKSTKNGEKEVDIKPFIYRLEIRESDVIYLFLASASANYTRPDTVMDAFLQTCTKEPQPFSYKIHRLETYAASEDGTFVPLGSLGTEIDGSTGIDK